VDQAKRIHRTGDLLHLIIFSILNHLPHYCAVNWLI